MEIIRKTISNYVGVRIDDSNEWYDKNGLKLKLDVSFEPEKNAQVVGEVVSRPEKLYFNKKDPKGMDYDIPVEIQNGDKVIFHFLSVMNAKKEGRFEGDIVYLPYESLFGVLTKDIPRPVNGWLFVRPKRYRKTGLLEGVFGDEEVSRTEGVVVSAGHRIIEYRYDKWDPEVNVGDHVRFRAQDSIPLFYSVQDRVGELLYRMRRSDVLAVECEDCDPGPFYSHATGRWV